MPRATDEGNRQSQSGRIDRSITHPLRVDAARRPDGGGVVRRHVLVLLDADERVLAGDASLPQQVVVPRAVGGGPLVELVPVGVVAEGRHGGGGRVVAKRRRTRRRDCICLRATFRFLFGLLFLVVDERAAAPL